MFAPRFSLPTVKPFISQRSLFLLLILLTVSIGAVLVGAKKKILPTVAANSKTPQSMVATRKLVGTYYNLKGDMQGMVMLSNQGPAPMPVRAALLNRAGTRLELPVFTLAGNEVRSIDLQQANTAGANFEEGSIEVVYEGRPLELGGLVVLMNTAQSLVFEEELVEPVKAFASSRLDGVWWRPTGNTEIDLALSNNSEAAVSVTIQASGEGNANSKTIQLAAHTTRVLTTENHSADELDLNGKKGGISITHTGAPGAVTAHGLIQEPDKGFSNVIDFSDQQKSKLNRLDGVGLRFGSVSGKQLKQVVVLRNIGDAPTIVNGRIPYTRSNGNQEVVTMPSLQLAPGEIKEVNLPAITPANQIAAAGLEFTYTGNPGSMIASALSYSSDRNQVFRVPMKDASVQASSTGHYPWSINDASATLVYIKNTTDTQKRFVVFLNFAGGDYVPGVKTIEAGQSMMFDLRKMRDEQIPDASGNVIPLTVEQGQLHWSIQGAGAEYKTLIGRAEQPNVSTGLTTTSACGLCCPDNFVSSWLTPGSASGVIGSTTTFVGWRQDITCTGYWFNYPFAYSGGWSSDSSSVATCNSSGVATATGVGNTYIRNSYGYEIYTSVIEYCTVDYGVANAAASCTVAPSISGPQTLWWFNGQVPSGYATSVTLSTAAGYQSYSWSITSGNDKIEFVGNTNSYSVVVRSKGRSQNLSDCGVTVTASGITSPSRTLTVKAPHTLALNGAPTDSADGTWGYDTRIHYRIRDQFTTALPSGVPINEQWTTAVTNDFTGATWRRGSEFGLASTGGSDFDDHIQGELVSYTPAAVAPNHSSANVAVQHWGQAWYIGSETIGSGRKVQTNTFQKNRGYARHTGITTPAP